jgi:outer membrane lipoprotein-sorting protein
MLVVASTLTFSSESANAQSAGMVSSILNRIDQNRRSLRSLRAGLVMQKYNAQIKDADTSFGGVVYQPGAKNPNVRIEWVRPQQEILAVSGGKYVLFRPRLNMAYEGSSNSEKSKVSGVLGFGLNISGGELRTKFDVEPLGKKELNGATVDHIKLIPRGRAGYNFAEIWVDGSGMPVQTRVVERNGDMTTVQLQNIQKNARVAPGDFRLDLPGSVKRVRS